MMKKLTQKRAESVSKKLLAATLVGSFFALTAPVFASDSTNDYHPYVGLGVVSKSFHLGSKGKLANLNSTVPAAKIFGGFSLIGFNLSASYLYGSGQSIHGTMTQYDLSADYPMTISRNLNIAPAITFGRMGVNANNKMSFKSNYLLIGVNNNYAVNNRVFIKTSLFTGRNMNPWVAGLNPSTSGQMYRFSTGLSFSITRSIDLGVDLEYTYFPVGHGLSITNWNTSGSAKYKF